MAKMGRPKVENPMEHLSIRLDAETKQILNEYCTDKEKSRGAVIREAVHLLCGKK
mgnify:CR=1 FL=1